MLKNIFTNYINNFRGFTREVWILATITFINRAGTMVLPFLSKYLKEDLHFTYNQVGWIMVAFGFGSMLGSWLGGKLSDKIGFYKIMIFSLFTSGVSLFFVQYITTFWALCAAMFVLMTIADMFASATNQLFKIFSLHLLHLKQVNYEKCRNLRACFNARPRLSKTNI